MATILDHTGQPIRRNPNPGQPWGDDGFALPHVLSFPALLGTAWQSYWADQWDEARRNSKENSRAMRLDSSLRGPLRERYYSVVNLPWRIEVPDEHDPEQARVRDHLSELVEQMPRFRPLLWCGEESVWYGRHAVQFRWEWNYHQGIKSLTPVDWFPISGDKIHHTHEHIPIVLVSAAHAEELTKRGPGAEIISTNVGPKGLVLSSRWWREQFWLTYAPPEDVDFLDVDQAEAIHGVGLRSILYWCDWLRREWLENLTVWIERFGLGCELWLYPSGNAQAEAQMRSAAEKSAGNRTRLLVPFFPGQNQAGVQRVEVAGTGAELLIKLIQYIDDLQERVIVGQHMSSDSKGSNALGGSGAAALQQDTKTQIRDFDAVCLAESFTGSRRRPGPLLTMQRYTFPDSLPSRRNPHGFQARFRFNLEGTQNDQTLQAAATLVQMGVPVRIDDLYSAGGLQKPNEGDDVVGGQQPGAMPDEPDAGNGEPGAEEQLTGQEQPPEGQPAGGLPVVPDQGEEAEDPEHERLKGLLSGGPLDMDEFLRRAGSNGQPTHYAEPVAPGSQPQTNPPAPKTQLAAPASPKKTQQAHPDLAPVPAKTHQDLHNLLQSGHQPKWLPVQTRSGQVAHQNSLTGHVEYTHLHPATDPLEHAHQKIAQKSASTNPAQWLEEQVKAGTVAESVHPETGKKQYTWRGQKGQTASASVNPHQADIDRDRQATEEKRRQQTHDYLPTERGEFQDTLNRLVKEHGWDRTLFDEAVADLGNKVWTDHPDHVPPEWQTDFIKEYTHIARELARNLLSGGKYVGKLPGDIPAVLPRVTDPRRPPENTAQAKWDERPARQFSSLEEADKWASEAIGPEKANVTDEERDELARYQHLGASVVNRDLRGNTIDRHTRERVKWLDGVLNRSRLPEPVQTQRVIFDTQQAFGLPGHRVSELVGQTLPGKGYLSTTLDPELYVTKGPRGNILSPDQNTVQLVIHAPAGTGAIYMRPVATTPGKQNEYELLLQRGMQYRVVGHDVKTFKRGGVLAREFQVPRLHLVAEPHPDEEYKPGISMMARQQDSRWSHTAAGREYDKFVNRFGGHEQIDRTLEKLQGDLRGLERQVSGRGEDLEPQRDRLRQRVREMEQVKARADRLRGEAEKSVHHTDEQEALDSYRREQTRAPLFKTWFGDWENRPENASRVVDESGRPVPVYHGTMHGGFSAFDPDKVSEDNLFGKGFYFTQDPEVASSYTDKGQPDYKPAMSLEVVYNKGMELLLDLLKDPGVDHEYFGTADAVLRFMKAYKNHDAEVMKDVLSNHIGSDDFDRLFEPKTTKGVYKAYLNIRRPFDMDRPLTDEEADKLRQHLLSEAAMKGSRSKERLKDWDERRQRAPLTGEDTWRILENIGGYKEFANNILRKAGYDGLTHMGGSRWGGGDKRHRVWIAFDPKKVKAVHQPGTFRQDTADISMLPGKDPRIDQDRQGVAAAREQEQRSLSPEAQEYHDQIMAQVDQNLDAAEHLHPEKRTAYRQAFETVSRKMPDRGRARLRENLGGIHFYNTVADVGRSAYQSLLARTDISPERRQKYEKDLAAVEAGTLSVAGAVTRHDGKVHLDGPDDQPTEWIYAHEVAEAVNKDLAITQSPEWKDAHQEEMANPEKAPTTYAASSADEGLPELFAAHLTGKLSQEEGEQLYPRCTAIAREHGLWPESRGDDGTPPGTEPPALSPEERQRRIDADREGVRQRDEQFKNFATGEEGSNWAREAMHPDKLNLSKQEEEAILGYVGWSQGMNAAMRKMSAAEQEKFKKDLAEFRRLNRLYEDLQELRDAIPDPYNPKPGDPRLGSTREQQKLHARRQELFQKEMKVRGQVTAIVDRHDANMFHKVRVLDRVMNRSTVPQNVVVNRLVRTEAFLGKKHTGDPQQDHASLESLVGKVIRGDNYLSTTLDPDIHGAREPYQETRFRISVPRGTHGVYVEPLAPDHLAKEREIILDRGYRYRVDAVTTENHPGTGQPEFIVHATVLPREEDHVGFDISMMAAADRAGTERRRQELAGQEKSKNSGPTEAPLTQEEVEDLSGISPMARRVTDDENKAKLTALGSKKPKTQVVIGGATPESAYRNEPIEQRSVYAYPDWPDHGIDEKRVYTPHPGEEDHLFFKEFADTDARPLSHAAIGELPASFLQHNSATLGRFMPLDADGNPRKVFSRHGWLRKDQNSPYLLSLWKYTATAVCQNINGALREEPEKPRMRKLDREHWDRIEQVISANGVFAQPVNLYRVLGFKESDFIRFMKAMEKAHQRRDVFSMPSLKSTMTHPGSFSPLGTQIMLEIRARTGLYLEGLTKYKGENEVLQRHNTHYEVTGIKEVRYSFFTTGYNRRVIQLREVLPNER